MSKVSIITPCFNVKDDKYSLSEDSVSKQTSQEFEWIIVNDGDGLYNGWYDVALSRNFGPSVARNVGFQISSGNIITYLDMGDTLDENRVENLIHLFDQYDIDLLFSAYDVVEPNGNVMRVDHMNHIGRSSRFPDALEYSKLWQYQNLSIPMGVAHTRKPFVLTGGFQRGIVCGEDGVLWRRMHDLLPGNKVMYSDTFAGIYYVSSNGQSRTQRRFEMGGFAIDGSLNDNGRYLDSDWYQKFSSEGYYE